YRRGGYFIMIWWDVVGSGDGALVSNSTYMFFKHFNDGQIIFEKKNICLDWGLIKKLTFAKN
ncbi:hypothetical protein L9F63_019847, partial [Diploptera punctata]